jgi:hypothetical protein
MRIEIQRLTITLADQSPAKRSESLPAAVVKSAHAPNGAARKPLAGSVADGRTVGLEAEALANEKLVQAGRMAEVGVAGRGALGSRGGIGVMLQRRDAAAGPDLAWRIKAELTKDYLWGPLKIRAATMSVEDLALYARLLPVEGAWDVPMPTRQSIVLQWLVEAGVPRVSGLGMAGAGGSSAGSPPSPLGRTLGSLASFLQNIPTAVTLGNPKRIAATADTGGLSIAHEGTALRLSAGIGWDRLFQAKAAYQGLEFSASARVLGSDQQEIKLGLQYGPDIPDLNEAREKFQGAGSTVGNAIVNVPRLVGHLQEQGIRPLAGIADAVEQAKKIAGERERTLPLTFGIEAKASRDADSPPALSVTGNVSLRWDLLKKALPVSPQRADDERLPPLPQGGGRPLGPALQEHMELFFGRTLPDVQIHTGAAAESAAAQLGAEAFTLGRDVYFGAGKYAPDTRKGLGLLGHELTHVLQQDDRRAAGARRAGGRDTGTLEGEAEAAAQTIMTSSSAVHRDALVIDDYRQTHRVNGGGPLTDAERATLDVIATRGREICEQILRAEHPTALRGDQRLPKLRMTFAVDLSGVVPDAAAKAWGRKMADTIVGAGRSGSGAGPVTPQSTAVLLSPDSSAPPPAPPSTTPAAAGGAPPPASGPPSTSQLVEDPVMLRKTLNDLYIAGGELEAQAYIDRYEREVAKEGEDLGQPEGVKPTLPVGGVPDDYDERVKQLPVKRRIRDLLKAEFQKLQASNKAFEDQFADMMKQVTIGLLDDSKDRTDKEASKLGLVSQTVRAPGVSGSARLYRANNKGAVDAIKKTATELIRLGREKEKLSSKPAGLGIQGGSFGRALQNPSDVKAYTKARYEYLMFRQQAEQSFPIISWYADDEGQLARLATGDLATILGERIDNTLTNIAYVREHLEEKKDNLWANERIRGLSSKGLRVNTGSVEQRVVFDKTKSVAEDKEFQKNVIEMAQTALGLLSLVPGGAVLALPANAAIIGIELDEYMWEKAMAGSDVDKARALSQNEPSLFNIAVDILSVVGDLTTAASHFRRLASLRNAFIAAEEGSAASKVLNTLKEEGNAIKVGMGDQLSKEASQAAAAAKKSGRKVGAHTLLVTDAKGGILTEEQLSLGLFKEHPHHAAIEESLRSISCALEQSTDLGRAAATATYVRVIGPEGKTFFRARIRYHPDIATSQDIYHELTHIEHFRSGRMKPMAEIDAAGNAAFYEEMKTKSVSELLDLSTRMPRPAAADPVMAKAQQEVRRAVEEISTHLHEIEEFGYTVKKGEAGRTDITRTAITDAYARGARNNIEEIYMKQIRSEINNILKEQRQPLKEYIQNYVKTTYPELPNEFSQHMVNPTVPGQPPPQPPSFWKRIGVPEP